MLKSPLMRALFFTLINNYWLHSSFDYDECECGDMCEGPQVRAFLHLIFIRTGFTNSIHKMPEANVRS